MPIRIPAVLLLACTLLIAAVAAQESQPPTPADVPAPADMTGKDILQRMMKTYKFCRSYQDTGAVKTIFHSDTRRRVDTKPFATAFVRADERFRFQYKETRQGGSTSYYIICQKNDAIRTWWDIQPGVNKSPSLQMALGTAGGVSSRTSTIVPGMLMPDERIGYAFAMLRNVERLEDQTIEDDDGDAKCFRIQGKEISGDTLIAWIEQETFLLRRLDTRKQFDDFRTETTFTWKPIMNEPVPEEALAFNPPQRDKADGE